MSVLQPCNRTEPATAEAELLMNCLRLRVWLQLHFRGHLPELIAVSCKKVVLTCSYRDFQHTIHLNVSASVEYKIHQFHLVFNNLSAGSTRCAAKQGKESWQHPSSQAKHVVTAVVPQFQSRNTGVSAVSGLTNLTLLDLNDNQIIDISAISGLTNLGNLQLYNNLSSVPL